jgi:serine phosphatase RsbU (regulator of sigma subunit)
MCTLTVCELRRPRFLILSDASHRRGASCTLESTMIDDSRSSISLRASCFSGAVSGRGGDRAAAIDCPEGNRYVFVCDVAGKGESAEAPADFLLSAVRMLICQGMSVAVALETLGLGLEHYFGRVVPFASAFLGRWDDGVLTWASAGHPDAFVLRDGRRHEHLRSTGPVLGLDRHARFAERRTVLAGGVVLVVAPDGIHEAHRHEGGVVGGLGVVRAGNRVARDGGDDCAEGFARAIVAEAEISDDFAVLIGRASARRTFAA